MKWVNILTKRSKSIGLIRSLRLLNRSKKRVNSEEIVRCRGRLLPPKDRIDSIRARMTTLLQQNAFDEVDLYYLLLLICYVDQHSALPCEVA